jgi:hypothetical protein
MQVVEAVREWKEQASWFRSKDHTKAVCRLAIMFDASNFSALRPLHMWRVVQLPRSMVCLLWACTSLQGRAFCSLYMAVQWTFLRLLPGCGNCVPCRLSCATFPGFYAALHCSSVRTLVLLHPCSMEISYIDTHLLLVCTCRGC